MAVSKGIVHEADVLVIGGGMGGCFAAVKAREAGAAKVIQLDKGYVGKTGCSAFAAGVYMAFNPEDDDYDKVFNDVLVEPGHFIVDQERLQAHLEQVGQTVRDMENWGIEFERTKDGKLERHKGRGEVDYIMFHGPQFMEALARQAKRKSVEQINKTMMTDLLIRHGQVVGAVAFNSITGEWHVFKAGATVLATGGTFYKGLCPGLRNVTGDGLVAAYKAGTDITSMEFPLRNSFPARYDIGPGMGMYVGSGAKFLNAKNERFMEKYAPDLKDRALLTVLDFAFAMELKQGNAPIYLDMTHFTPEQVQRLRRVIPLPIMMYERIGLVKDDRFVEKMEWMAYAPRSIGGCLTDKQFKTCLSGLYACGDAIPWSGAEGGAAALPGAATSGSSAGRYAAEFAREVGRVEVDELQVQHVIEQNSQLMEREDGIEHDHVLLAVQETIMPYEVLLLREEGRMQNALTKIEDIRDNLAPYLFASDPHYLRMALEAKNLVTCAEMQLRSAIYRKESRGGFCIREDYPFTDNVNWLKWVSAKKDSEGMKIFAQDIPIDRYPVKPSLNRVIDPLWQQAKDLGIVTVEEERIIWE